MKNFIGTIFHIILKSSVFLTAIAILISTNSCSEDQKLDSGGTIMDLGSWKDIQPYEMDLDISLYLNKNITSVEYRMRDNAIIEEKTILERGNGKVFTQRVIGAYFNLRTTNTMKNKSEFIRRIKSYFKNSYVEHEETRKIEHSSKNGEGYYAIVNTTKIVKRCFFSRVGYRLGEDTGYSNDEGQFDTIVTLHYCDPSVSADDFKEILTKVDISGGEKELRAMLAAKGIRANTVATGRTTQRETSELGAAVIAGDLPKVEALLAAGADPNAETAFTRPRWNGGREWHTSVLVASIVYQHPEVVDALLKSGVSFDKYQNSFAICPAVNSAQTSIVAALIKAGIDVNPNFTCIRNLTPLESAKRRGYDGIVKMLVDAGAT